MYQGSTGAKPSAGPSHAIHESDWISIYIRQKLFTIYDKDSLWEAAWG